MFTRSLSISILTEHVYFFYMLCGRFIHGLPHLVTLFAMELF